MVDYIVWVGITFCIPQLSLLGDRCILQLSFIVTIPILTWIYIWSMTIGHTLGCCCVHVAPAPWHNEPMSPWHSELINHISSFQKKNLSWCRKNFTCLIALHPAERNARLVVLFLKIIFCYLLLLIEKTPSNYRAQATNIIVPWLLFHIKEGRCTWVARCIFNKATMLSNMASLTKAMGEFSLKAIIYTHTYRDIYCRENTGIPLSFSLSPRIPLCYCYFSKCPLSTPLLAIICAFEQLCS